VVALPVLFLFSFLGLLVWAAATSSAARQRRDDLLTLLAGELNGRRDSNTAYGTLGGSAVAYRFETYGAGSSSEYWMEVDVQIPHAYPLELHVRRHGRHDASLIARGDMIDVEIGDPAFDPLFLVEAAPSDVARILLDPEARGFLASRSSGQLDTLVREDGARVLRFAARGWTEDVAAAKTELAAIARLGTRIREAFALADQAHAPVDRGSPYRPEIDDSRAREAAAARTKEIDELRAAQIRREVPSGFAVMMFFVLSASIMGLALCSHR
jgi:hypothetical protein